MIRYESGTVYEHVVLSLDFDAWHIGDALSEGASWFGHCGRCKAYRAEARVLENVRPTKQVDISRGYDERVPPKKKVINMIPKGTPIFVAESHADIASVVRKYPNAHVVDLDFHKDDYGIQDNELDCATWIEHLFKNGLMKEYSRLVDGPPERPDVVFTCKSSPYLIKSADKKWNLWLKALQEQAQVGLQFIGHRARKLRSEYARNNG